MLIQLLPAETYVSSDDTSYQSSMKATKFVKINISHGIQSSSKHPRCYIYLYRHKIYISHDTYIITLYIMLSPHKNFLRLFLRYTYHIKTCISWHDISWLVIIQIFRVFPRHTYHKTIKNAQSSSESSMSVE